MLRDTLEVDEAERTSAISQILNYLDDGSWHKIDEITSETKIANEPLLRVLNFFRDYKIVEISIGGEAAKLDKDYIKL